MPPNQSISPKPKRHLPKKLLLVGLSIVAVLAIALGTTILLSRIMPSKPTTTQSKEEQAAIIAKQKLGEAQNSEAKGKTDEAIAQYKEALKQYQAAGDKSGEESVKLQIAYLESVKNISPDAPAIITTTDPTSVESYGKALPNNTP